MQRRAFIAGIGSTLSLPLVAHAQDKQIVGFLRSTPAAPFAQILAAFRDGLAKAGFNEGQNVIIEQRWAENRIDRLPELARDLVQRGAKAIVGNGPAIQAAKTVTTVVPLVFVVGTDPVESGLVDSLSRPTGNVTGVTFFGGNHLNAKRLDLLRDVAPRATTIAVLVDSNYDAAMRELPTLEAAARTLGQRLITARVSKDSELESAFEKAMQDGARALLVSSSPLLTSQRQRVVALAARHHLPAIYDLREYVQAGGLISYSANIAEAYRQAGAYAVRILKGERPPTLPVLQATEIELAINMKTAGALGITIPPPLLAAADQIVE